MSNLITPDYETLLFTPAFKVGGTKSCRLASAKLLKLFATNAQNISDDDRGLFVPRPGFKFAQDDLEGAEAVVVALCVREGRFRDLVRLKIKPHNFVCIKLFPTEFHEYISQSDIDSLTPKSLKAHPKYKEIVKRCKLLKMQYDIAKRTVHGGNYGMSWKTLQATVLKESGGTIILTAAESKRLLGVYFELFPEIKLYQTEADSKAKEFEPIYDMFGADVRLIQRYTAELGRTAASLPPQRTVGLITIIGASRLQRYIEDNNRRWNVLNIVHDSILGESPIDEAVELATKMAECMTFELTSPVDGWKFSIGVEKSIGMNWGKYDETDNPEGLQVIE